MKSIVNNLYKFLIFAAVVCVVVNIIIYFFDLFFLLSYPDIQNLWSAACLARQGLSTTCDLQPIVVACGLSVLRSYPPWSLPFYYWTSFLNLHELVLIWKFVSQILFGICAFLFLYCTASESKWGIKEYFWAIFAVVFWFPTYDHIQVGQLTVVQFLSFLIAFILFNKKSFYLSGLFLAVSAIKPQTIYLVYFVIGIKAVTSADYRKVTVSMLLWLLLFGVAGWELRQHLDGGIWPIKSEEVSSWIQPNFGSHLQSFFGNIVWVRWIPTFLTVTSLVFLSSQIKNVFSYSALLFLLPLSLLTSPYTNIHDGVILSYLVFACGLAVSKNLGFVKESIFLSLMLVIFLVCCQNPKLFEQIGDYIWVTCGIWLILLVFSRQICKQKIDQEDIY